MAGQLATERDVTSPLHEIRAPSFVGREGEVAAFARTLATPPSVVLIEGEAGIGKTRLVREFLASPAGKKSKALVFMCPPLRQPLTLGPVVDALRQNVSGLRDLQLSALAGALRPLFPEWVTALPPAPEPLEDATAARHRVFSALGELFARLRVDVLVIEDAHWADEVTLEFLLFLASRQPQSVSLVVTYRPEDVPDGSLLPRLSRLTAGSRGLRLALRPLDVAQTATLVSSMLAGGHVTERFAMFLHSHTDGLPLAIEESVRLMRDRADLAFRDGAWTRRRLRAIEVPPTVRDAVLERAGRLSLGALAVLRAAAVLGEPAAKSVLTAVADLTSTATQAGLCEALNCGLLIEESSGGQGLVFRHALAAQAVYEAILAPLRREMHMRAGLALEQSSPLPLALLTRHFRESDDADKWRYYAERAADQALEAGDQGRAAALLYEVVSAGGASPEELVRLVRKIPLNALSGYACLGELTQCLRSVLSAEALTPALRAEAGFLLGRILLSADEYEAGFAELERAIPYLGHRPVDAAHAMIGLGWPSRNLWPARAHRCWLDRAVAAVDLVPSGDRLALLVDRATALLKLGDEAGWAAAAELPEQETTSGEPLEVVRGLLNTGYAVMLWGRYGESMRRLTTALDLADRHGFVLLHDMVLVSRAHLEWFTGAWTGLAGRLAVLDARDDMEPMARLEAQLVTGLLDTAAQQSQEAGEENLRLVLAESQRYGMLDTTLQPAAALARLQLRKGRIEDALELTEDPIRVIAAKGIWIWATDVAPVRVQALCAADRGAEAAELMKSFARGLRGRNAPAPEAALTLCGGLLTEAVGGHSAAAAAFGQAADSWQALPRPYDALLARERQAVCLLAAGERDNALNLLTETRQRLARLGAVSDAGRVAALLRGHGVVRGGRRGRRGYGDQLSPRELEVVRLLAQGQADREIAASLVVTPKTVAYHLDSARRKLRAHSRTALLVAALSAGIIPKSAVEATDIQPRS